MEEKIYHLSAQKGIQECGLQQHYKDEGGVSKRNTGAIMGSAFHHAMSIYCKALCGDSLPCDEEFIITRAPFLAGWIAQVRSSIDLRLDTDAYHLAKDLTAITFALIDFYEFGPDQPEYRPYADKELCEQFFYGDEDFTTQLFWGPKGRSYELYGTPPVEVVKKPVAKGKYPQWEKFIDQFQELLNDPYFSKLKIIRSEFNMKFEIDGRKIDTTIDVVGLYKDKVVIVDFKTGKEGLNQFEIDENPQYNGYCYGYKQVANIYAEEFWHIQTREYENYVKQGTFNPNTNSGVQWGDSIKRNSGSKVAAGSRKGAGIHRSEKSPAKIDSFKHDFLATIFSYEAGIYTRALNKRVCANCNFQSECSTFRLPKVDRVVDMRINELVQDDNSMADLI